MKEGFQTVYVSFTQGLFPEPVQVGFVVDIVALEQFICDYFVLALYVEFHQYCVLTLMLYSADTDSIAK